MNKQLIFSLIFILVASLTPGNGKIFGAYLDKLVHFGMYFFLGMNIIQTFSNEETKTAWLLWAIVGGLTIEIIQQYIPGRGLDMYDGIANTLGIIGAFYWKRKKAKE